VESNPDVEDNWADRELPIFGAATRKRRDTPHPLSSAIRIVKDLSTTPDSSDSTHVGEDNAVNTSTIEGEDGMDDTPLSLPTQNKDASTHDAALLSSRSWNTAHTSCSTGSGWSLEAAGLHAEAELQHQKIAKVQTAHLVITPHCLH
jgi:hypothetical protein